MAVTFDAEHDQTLKARVISKREMTYVDGPSNKDDRPPYVRAASGLSAYREYLAVVQDDTNWLALIDAEQRVTPVPLPRGPHGNRVFSAKRGNQADKYDLEACVTVDGPEGLELIGFASGSRAGHDYVLRVSEKDGQIGELQDRLAAEFLAASSFYKSMREQVEFSGAGLNIEGALARDHDTVCLFQRGNAEPRGTLQPIDATAEFSWSKLRKHLAQPEDEPPPTLCNIRTYDLGRINGVRLTFSDAELIGNDRVLYSASAEDPESGNVQGSVLGVIDAVGQARWTALVDQDGSFFQGKIEGLTLDRIDPLKFHFVIDDDDEMSPSIVYQARLSRSFLD
jgi:hypothetical protein